MQKYKPIEGSELDYDIVRHAHLLKREDAAAHRQKLKTDPDDLKSRLALFGRGYYKKMGASPEHLVWLVEQHPRRWIHCMIAPCKRNASYETVRASWLRVVRSNSEDVTVLAHAAQFFLHLDQKDSIKWLTRASNLAPSDDELPRQLSFAYRLVHEEDPKKSRLLAHKAVQQMQTAIERYAIPTEDHSYLLQYFSMEVTDTAKHALNHGLLDEAKELGKILLNHRELNRSRRPMLEVASDAHYRLSTYRGHLILGRVALRKGEIEKAEAYLSKMTGLQAGWYTDYDLAKELLAAGAAKAAVPYIEKCRDSLAASGDRNFEDLDKWLKQIRRKHT
ncbi:MAG: hypothetical protein HYX67_03775 [Candidatus Melainabacteria bacterium]|nr:hypothetical protein [Candidatus Melainabacteria bacterium]